MPEEQRALCARTGATVKSRAASGLALLLAGALFAVLTVPGGGSDAATDPAKIGTVNDDGTRNAGNPLTVNVQEIPESEDGSSGVFDLTKYGNLDW
jgi:hypothetical protein